jgi:hypothetical protein
MNRLERLGRASLLLVLSLGTALIAGMAVIAMFTR